MADVGPADPAPLFAVTPLGPMDLQLKRLRPARLRPVWLVSGVMTVLLTTTAGLMIGPVFISPIAALGHLLGFHTSLTPTEIAILEQIRLPRVVLGLLVGGTLAISGASYPGVFRNPLADPYLLGAAAGAGLAVTLVIAGGAGGGAGGGSTVGAAPLAAFLGALCAVGLMYVLGVSGGGRASMASLILSGVAVGSFLTALQTYIQQGHQDTIRQVCSWILSRLSTAGWHDELLLVPYAAGSWIVLLTQRRILDVLAVGDDEAATLGIDVRRTRLVVIISASLGTAAAVSVSGLIGFVGIIVPHAVRLLAGGSHRVATAIDPVRWRLSLCC